MEFRRFDTLKESDTFLRKYEVRQALTRIPEQVKNTPQLIIKKPSKDDID